MANLDETGTVWPAAIYQIEQTDPVLGGAPNEATGAGITNIPTQQLARRTRMLKEQQDQMALALGASLAENGYQRLPSGLIIQWGYSIISVTTGQNITLPIAFPNQHLQSFATDAGENTYIISAQPISLTQIRLWAMTPANTRPTGAAIRWLALGF